MAKPRRVQDVIGEGIRELGVLVIMFGWLEPTIHGEPLTVKVMCGIAALGLCLFTIGTIFR